MCPHESPGRLLESVSDYRSRWMVISLAIARQNPAYRATLLKHKWAGAKSPLTFLFQIVSGLTQPIPNFAKFSGKKVGLRTDFSDIQELFVVVCSSVIG